MTVLRRGTYWHYDFWEGGRRYQGSTRRTVRREAEQVEAAERRRVLDGTQLGTQATTTVSDAARAWLAAVGLKLRDARNNDSRVRKLLGKGGLPPDLELTAITPGLLGQLADRRSAGGNADGTINRELALVQAIVAHAASRGFQAPLLRLKGIRRRETPKSRFLSPVEVTRVLQELHPAGDPMRVDQYHLAVLLWDTGARYSEVAELQWLDVIETPRPALRFVQTKSDRPRMVALGPAGQAIVAERRAQAQPRVPYVFPGAGTGGPRGYAVGGILAALERAGCNAPELVERYGRATVHTLRHSHAAMLLRKGVPLHHVSARLGHASVALTQRVYGHIQASDGDEAVLAALGEAVVERE